MLNMVKSKITSAKLVLSKMVCERVSLLCSIRSFTFLDVRPLSPGFSPGGVDGEFQPVSPRSKKRCILLALRAVSYWRQFVVHCRVQVELSGLD